MSFLQDGVYTSVSFHGRGFFRFDRISADHKRLIKSINARQRRKFKKHEIIPWQLLSVLWDWGFLPGEKKTMEGMKISRLLHLIETGEYRNEMDQERGTWLRKRIVEEEWMPRLPPGFRKRGTCLKVGNTNKVIPTAYVKNIPGTILRW